MDMPQAENWQCPHCLQWSSLEEQQYHAQDVALGDNADQLSYLKISVVVCKNAKCRKVTISADLVGMVPTYKEGLPFRRGRVRSYQLVPDSKAKPQPPYIPEQIVSDYREASLIVGLSPKASATLSRRCLQGMIRDFFDIKDERRLRDEIDAIKDLTPPAVWAAIDATREIGNIGAHMEKDVNVIVDVDEKEAGLLLGLIEQLFDDWYVTRHKQQERLAAITTMASEKDAQKTARPVDPAGRTA
jgi:hypothetical protein